MYEDNNGSLINVTDGKRKRTTSFDGSMSSLDDSGLSISESCSSSSGMSSPATTVDEPPSIRHYDEENTLLHRQRSLHYQQEMILQQFRENVVGPPMLPQAIAMNPTWIDLAYSYLSRSYPAPLSYAMAPPPFGMPMHVVEQRAAAVHMMAAESEYVRPAQSSPIDERTTPKEHQTKKCNFSISAILGCDS